MRDSLSDASLDRYAGRFVWLELDFDKPGNRAFLTSQGVTSTPQLFVLEPERGRATAVQLGGLSVPELREFLERGERVMRAGVQSRAEAALTRADAFLGRGRHAQAIATYRDALRLGGDTWPGRGRALSSLTWALSSSGQSRECAETAAETAPGMAHSESFSRVVLAGLICVNQGPPAGWKERPRKTLEPLAAEAIDLPVTLRDHRFQLFQQLMYSAHDQRDEAAVERWGRRWLDEIDTTRPRNDDERSALDVARVDAEDILGDPERVLPALAASERAMPTNYNASLRLAQMELEARHCEAALAACKRGLAHVTGPLGRCWLLQVEADALSKAGRRAEARQVLVRALRAARQIGSRGPRENNVAKVSKALAALR